jgi:hypothetical protein
MTSGRKNIYLSSMLVVCCAVIIPHSPGRAADFSYACEKEGAIRSVEVVRTPGFACRVKYTKPAGTSFPWNAQTDAGYCGPQAIRLVERLSSLGWECESSEELRAILHAQIERYARYTRILNNVGKTCYFYPGEAQFGNLCGDAREEAAIVYSCEFGTDGWDQHLAVFLDIETEPLITEVGSSRYRQVSSYHIDNKRVMLEIEKFNAPAGTDTDQIEPGKTSIECRNSTASQWELIEKE